MNIQLRREKRTALTFVHDVAGDANFVADIDDCASCFAGEVELKGLSPSTMVAKLITRATMGPQEDIISSVNLDLVLFNQELGKLHDSLSIHDFN